MVGLHGEGHAVALEPGVGIVLGEAFHEALHETMTTGIDGAEVADILEGVGAVAASAAGDLDLAQEMLAALVDGDVHLRAHLLEVDGEEEAGGTSADDGCSHGDRDGGYWRVRSLRMPWR